jgi:serine/threonine-protein kinase RIO1
LEESIALTELEFRDMEKVHNAISKQLAKMRKGGMSLWPKPILHPNNILIMEQV